MTIHNLGETTLDLMADTFGEKVRLDTNENGFRATARVGGMVARLLLREKDGQFYVIGGYEEPNSPETVVSGIQTPNYLDAIDAINISIGRISSGINDTLNS